jgi:hypothetical protein
MASFQEYRRRSLIPLAGICLALYYVLVFVPLSHRSDNLDEPLDRAWNKLAASLEQTNATTLDFQAITNQLNEIYNELDAVKTVRQQVSARLQPSPALQSRLGAPFQLLEYQNERGKQLEELVQQGKARGVNVEPAVPAGYPEYTADMQEPALLWAALVFTEDLVDTALRCQLTSLHSLQVSLPATNSASPELPERWARILIQFDFTGAATNAMRLLAALPLRGSECKTAGVPDAPAQKNPLFIDHLFVRKQSPEKPDEVRVWLQASGFAPRP